MDDTAASMARIAPFLWDLLDTLLLTRGKTTNVAASEGPEGEPGGEDEEYWEHMNFPEDSDELEQVILNVTSANSGLSTGICYTLQQCYIDTVVTHSTHSSHSNVYLLYNTSIVL